MRRVVLWLLLVGAVWLIVSRRTDVERLAATLSHGRWDWVALAVAFQVLYYLAFSGVYQAAFHAVGVNRQLREVAPVLFASIFINVVAPSASIGSAAVFVDDAVRRGDPPARATAGVLLATVATLASFSLVLVFGIVYLFTRHLLETYVIVAAALLMILVLGLSGLLVVGLWLPSMLRGSLGWFERVVNSVGRRFRERPVLAPDWAERNAAELRATAEAIGRDPHRIAAAFLIGLGAHVLDLFSLWALFVAFGYHPGPDRLITGFAIGILFWIVSPVPEGIGIVEGVMALIYTSLDVPSGVAVIVPIAFRGITFWIPLLIGLALVSRTKSFQESTDPRVQQFGVHAVAVLVAIVGLINVVSAVVPALAYRAVILQQVLPQAALNGARVVAALAGVGLLMLAIGLWRRERVAWALSMGLLIVSVITHLIKGLDYEESAMAAVLALWLFTLRGHFPERPGAEGVTG